MAMIQVIFLLLFVAYFVIGVVALAVDAEAMDAVTDGGEECAENSWIWLYSLLVIVIPTSMGFVLGLVKTGLGMIEALKDVKYDIFIALPPPLLMVTLGILGITLWSNMSEECNDFYEANHGLLLSVFHIQTIIMMIASVFGCITLFGMGAAVYADLTKKSEFEEVKSA